MYESFYNLSERPFSLTPDPRFLYMSPRHREALNNLTYGVATARAMTLLTGEAGTGKTTLVRKAFANADPNASYVIVNNPTMTRAEFVQLLAANFGLSDEAGQSKATWLLELEALLRERWSRGIVTALVLDEAQSLTDELLEEVRLLSNLETSVAKLLPIVLIGQPELSDRLNQASMRQLKQRIALRCELQPFDLPASAGYISARLRIAGGIPANTFTQQAVIAIHEAAQGIPRTINVLCDNALLSGFAAGARPVGSGIVREVCRDFQFAPAPHEEPAPAVANVEPRPDPEPDDTATAAAGDDHRGKMFASYSARPSRLSFLWTRH